MTTVQKLPLNLIVLNLFLLGFEHQLIKSFGKHCKLISEFLVDKMQALDFPIFVVLFNGSVLLRDKGVLVT